MVVANAKQQLAQLLWNDAGRFRGGFPSFDFIPDESCKILRRSAFRLDTDLDQTGLHLGGR